MTKKEYIAELKEDLFIGIIVCLGALMILTMIASVDWLALVAVSLFVVPGLAENCAKMISIIVKLRKINIKEAQE